MLFSLFLPQLKISNNKSILISSYSNETIWQNGDGKYTSRVENRILNLIYQKIMTQKAQRKSIPLVSAQHLRYRRNIKESLENVTKITHCENFTFVIKSENHYEVWNNFSIKYKGKVYPYDTYSVMNDGLYVCNSSDELIQQRWRNVTVQDKKRIPYEYCNASVDSFYHENYTLFKDFNVFLKPTSQNFTKQDYGVISGYFSICSAKLSLSCNDYLLKVKYGEQYNVFHDFSLIYNNRKYDYREYRIQNNTIEMCASNHSTVLHIWRTRNSLEKSGLLRLFRCNYRLNIYKGNYSVSKHLTVYFSPTNQYFTAHEYDVLDGELFICYEKFRRLSFQYTKEDLLMCNDSIINLKYDDRYEVWNNFSIFYQKKMYSYIEYRALNDSIKICNSTDNFVKNIWKLRNYWVTGNRHSKRCDYLALANSDYIVDKQLTVYYLGNSKYFTRNDYDVEYGTPHVCKDTLRLDLYQHNHKDLLLCNNSIINIKYDDEYKVWNNFSILFKNKIYHYTEYRALNDSIKICNSTDNIVKNTWKLRKYWVTRERSFLKSCDSYYSSIANFAYIVNKQLTVYYSYSSQYLTRNDYEVENGTTYVCKDTLRPNSYQYTKEDLLMCNDSIIDIKYDDEYKVWNNFSILYKNKIYSYTEYRALNDSIKICNSTDNFMKNIWKLRNYRVKARRLWRSCDFDYLTIYHSDYMVNKQLTVYYLRSSQYFTRNDYNVEHGTPDVCSDTLKPDSYQYTKEDLLMCNDSVIDIEYDDEYKVWNNFSILYKNNMYSYTEYRALNDSIKICNSTDNFTQNIWKLRNKLVIARRFWKRCNFHFYIISITYYSINKDFTVYDSSTSQYFKRNDYGVYEGVPVVCNRNVGLESFQYTREDLFLCNDSIINIKYDDEYKVWNNFSILYKDKMYSYTEYRALNDGIKICNSTDNFEKNIWKLRNYWVILKRNLNSCNRPIVAFPLYQGEYDALKNFTLLIRASKLSMAKNDYRIFNGIPFLCVNKCVNSTSIINYEDEYRVWSNFTVMYKGKMYNYFEYRVTDNGLQICNSSDRLIKENWRNLTALEKRSTAYADCNGHVGGFYHENYTVCKNFSVFFKLTNQKFSRENYGVISGYFTICSASLTFSCNESLLEVKYGEQYEVFKNFSMFYERKVYDYNEYRFSRNGVKICTSNDVRVQAIFKTQNKWEKSLGAPCDRSYKLNAREYTVTKKFAIHFKDDGQVLNRHEYSVIDASPYVC